MKNRTITASANSFADTFPGVSRHVYQINDPATLMTASLASESGANASRDWAFQVYNTGTEQRRTRRRSLPFSHADRDGHRIHTGDCAGNFLSAGQHRAFREQ